MLSDIENIDIVLGGNNLVREESESNNSGRKPDSPCYDTSVNLTLSRVMVKLELMTKMAKV